MAKDITEILAGELPTTPEPEPTITDTQETPPEENITTLQLKLQNEKNSKKGETRKNTELMTINKTIIAENEALKEKLAGIPQLIQEAELRLKVQEKLLESKELAYDFAIENNVPISLAFKHISVEVDTTRSSLDELFDQIKDIKSTTIEKMRGSSGTGRPGKGMAESDPYSPSRIARMDTAEISTLYKTDIRFKKIIDSKRRKF